eukprot:1184950-Prorocentrum_minimum.AAC.4
MTFYCYTLAAGRLGTEDGITLLSLFDGISGASLSVSTWVCSYSTQGAGVALCKAGIKVARVIIAEVDPVGNNSWSSPIGWLRSNHGILSPTQSSFTCKWDAVGYRGLYTLDMCQTRGFHFPRCNSPLRARVAVATSFWKKFYPKVTVARGTLVVHGGSIEGHDDLTKEYVTVRGNQSQGTQRVYTCVGTQRDHALAV